MSFTHMATRSIPTVSNFRAAAATLTLVPTPSVPETSTGSLYFRAGKRKNPANEPISPSPSLRCGGRGSGRAPRPEPGGEGGPGVPAVQGGESFLPVADGPGSARRDADTEPAFPGARVLHRPDGGLPRSPADAPGDVRVGEADGLRSPQEPRHPLRDGPGIVLRRHHEGRDVGVPRCRHRVVPDLRRGVPRAGGVPRRPVRPDGGVRGAVCEIPPGNRVRGPPTGGGARRRCVTFSGPRFSCSVAPCCLPRPTGSDARTGRWEPGPAVLRFAADNVNSGRNDYFPGEAAFPASVTFVFGKDSLKLGGERRGSPPLWQGVAGGPPPRGRPA